MVDDAPRISYGSAMLFYVSILMTIAANLAYNLCQKTTAPEAPPLVALGITYSMALLTCIVLYFATSRSVPLSTAWRGLNFASYVLGPAIVLLEVGFLLAFRSGWNLGYAALFSNASASLLLVPIAYLFFGETIRSSQYLGIALTLAGLVLMVRR